MFSPRLRGRPGNPLATWLAGKKKEKETMSKDDLREKLTPLQYEVTQKDGTEPPFKNEY